MLVLSSVALICTLYEINFTLKYRPQRNYDYWLGAWGLFFVKANNVIRCSLYSGTLVTSLFYATTKVVALYPLMLILNLVAMIVLLRQESALQKY